MGYVKLILGACIKNTKNKSIAPIDFEIKANRLETPEFPIKHKY